MAGLGETQKKLLKALSNGSPRTLRQLTKETGISSKAAGNSLQRLWRDGYVLRTEKPAMEPDRVFKGRAGVSTHLKRYHSYILKPKDAGSFRVQGLEFVKFKTQLKVEKISKAKIILSFLEKNLGRAFYSKEIAEALKDKGIKPRDVMTHARRFERKGLVYVRGYRTHDRQSPFKEGYLLTWIDSTKPREQALEEAVQRTDLALSEKSATNPIIERIHIIRDQIIEATKLRDLTSFEFLQNRLNCSEYEAEGAISRALQLYPDLKEVKIFGNFRYYYHDSMPEKELKAAIALKENYIRIAKGRANRIGHNWEAVVEYFIDSLTTGARFWTQDHRNGTMEPRRITIHLIKPVGGRKYNAEVDRVWEVTPGPLLKPSTYVLECKWGLVRKKDVDDFFNVLAWSKEFGADTPDGRQIKQGIVGVFSGSAFDPKEKVRLKDNTEINLSSYAARMNVQLLKAADFNEKLRERGIPKEVTVQKICKIAKDEKEVRETLRAIWEEPEKSGKIIGNMINKNEDIYEFEKMLEND
ncbi:MAG: winged helix-turn-helix domain-containing protein [Candidatus Bathyarchaeota archaeon]|nr:winged helix-turn-helix domain-containing protein [Candidatus Bathyarchaeota archaeon]